MDKKFYNNYLKTQLFKKESNVFFSKLDLNYLSIKNFNQNLKQLTDKSKYFGTFPDNSNEIKSYFEVTIVYICYKSDDVMF